jgi:DNA-binding IclR family transcriptional regulator
VAVLAGLTLAELAKRIAMSQHATIEILEDMRTRGQAIRDKEDRWMLTTAGLEFGLAALDGLVPFEDNGPPLEPREHKGARRQDVPGFSRLEARERSSSGTIAA